MEHLEENGKPCLYLVFEYLSTDLKKFMDRNGKGPANPLPTELVKVSCSSSAGKLRTTELVSARRSPGASKHIVCGPGSQTAAAASLLLSK